MKRIILGLILLVAAIQLIRPDRTNLPEDPAKHIRAYVKVTEEVETIIARSCYDCHSNTVKWPWYSEIAPFSWVIADDVKSGRRHLNFSEWGTYSQKRMGKKLYQIAEVAGDSSMPLTAYLLAHPEARLSPAERKILGDWAEILADQFPDEKDPEPGNEKH